MISHSRNGEESWGREVTIDLTQLALTAYLKDKEPGYFGKLLELREAIEGWLGYIPQTFPHFTRHTIGHSEEILRQLSKILFEDEDTEQPVLQLSGAEVYVVAASAYLHDAGMVASDDEKAAILDSPEWEAWKEGEGSKGWEAYVTFRDGHEPQDETVRNFLAGVQLRYLLAAFIRGRHHLRSARLAKQHQGALGRYAYDDAILARTIADVCESHGLGAASLEDPDRYPEHCDIRGDAVNVRLLAILLRIGDLLDVSQDRACPLLMNAANPLPPDSIAHWEMNRSITRRMTAPDRIEIKAECRSQEEHRLLQDWFRWLQSETERATAMMARARRHGGWRPPAARVGGENPTIVIEPGEDADYVPVDWKLELDVDMVLERLIADVHESGVEFIRELLQNAFDATRCKMYADLRSDGEETPEFPTQADDQRRNRYPVKLSLLEEQVKNEHTGDERTYQVLEVEDLGTGMTRDIVQRFFLQVGRSFYTTEEFRRKYDFVPTSRFGVGFLSVFSASDHLVVETLSADGGTNEDSLKLTLTGPRNYLLTEVGKRRMPGTSIKIRLRRAFKPGELTRYVSAWCRKVEFPVHVKDIDSEVTLTAEEAEAAYEEPLVGRQARFALRVFPTECPGVEGEFYVLAYIDDEGERWDMRGWAESGYPATHPLAKEPPVPGSLLCINGISTRARGAWSGGDSWRARLDYRVNLQPSQQSMSRSEGVRWDAEPRIRDRLTEILRDHVAAESSRSGWLYLQRLVKAFDLPEFWESARGTLPLQVRGVVQDVSLLDVASLNVLEVVAFGPSRYNRLVDDEDRVAYEAKDDHPYLEDDDLHAISELHLTSLFEGRCPTSIKWSGDHLVVSWEKCKEEGKERFFAGTYAPIAVMAVPDVDGIGGAVHSFSRFNEFTVLNSGHPFVKWLQRLKQECLDRRGGLDETLFDRVLRHLRKPLRYGGYELDQLLSFLESLDELELPRDLQSTPVLEPESFRFKRRT